MSCPVLFFTLNSVPINELRNWCQQRLVGEPYKYEAQGGRFPWQPCEREPALQAANNKHSHTEDTYLTRNLTLPNFNDGWEGWGTKFVKSTTKAVICKDQESRQLQIRLLKLTRKHMEGQSPAATPQVINICREDRWMY